MFDMKKYLVVLFFFNKKTSDMVLEDVTEL